MTRFQQQADNPPPSGIWAAGNGPDSRWLDARYSIYPNLAAGIPPKANGRIWPAVFETELVAIDGVPKPDKIKTKAPTEGIAEKVASVAADAADAAKTFVADTDDVQGHEEL